MEDQSSELMFEVDISGVPLRGGVSEQNQASSRRKKKMNSNFIGRLIGGKFAVFLGCVLVSPSVKALPESYPLQGGNVWTQRAPNGTVVCETWQLLTRSNMTTWEISHGSNSSSVNITYHKRPRLGSTVNIGYAALITAKTFATNWHPGLPLPLVLSSNWFPNEGHLPQFETGASQGAITSVSTNPANRFRYTKISRMKQLAAWLGSPWAPCGMGDEVGNIYYLFRRGRVKDMKLFPGAATSVPVGGSNVVQFPFPINDYWFAMQAKVCSGCDPCWDSSWGSPNSIVIGSSTWSLAGFLGSGSTPTAGSGNAVGSVGLTGPVALVLNTRSNGEINSTLEIPAPRTGSVQIEKTSNFTVWEPLATRLTDDGYLLADDTGAARSGMYRLRIDGAEFSPAPSSAASVPTNTVPADTYECLRPFSHELRPVAIEKLDLVRFLEFEYFFGLQPRPRRFP